MLVAGAKGFAKEVLEIISQLNRLENLVFYDDVNPAIGDMMYSRFCILKNIDEAAIYFNTVDNEFTVGIGNPILRKRIYERFIKAGGELVSTISPLASIASFDVAIGAGANILAGAVIGSGSQLGKGCIAYYNTVIPHDCIIGDFVEISPGAILLGRCQVGSYSHIGANATILPDIKIGCNVIVGAGSVVTKDIPDNCMVLGVPAEIKKTLTALDF